MGFLGERSRICLSAVLAGSLSVAASAQQVPIPDAAPRSRCVRSPAGSTIAANRVLVDQFFDRASRQGFDRGLDLVADDAPWITPDGVKHTKAEIGQIVTALGKGLAQPFTFGKPLLIAEADRVSAELRVHAVRTNGRVYDNRYQFVFRIACGRIAEVHEYSDTHYARTVFSDANSDR